jgi:type II secretory pathway component PulC
MWPKLTVSGIIGSSKSGRSAVILNGQMLCPGDTMEGVSVESIDKQRVKLKFNGEVKMLSVGSSTE